MTEWRPIPGFDGYDVSSDGQIRSWRVFGHRHHRRAVPRLLNPTVNPTTGRLRVGLSTSGGPKDKEVQILVAAAFIGPRPEGLECCHNNGNPHDNRLENLRYDTHKANKADQILHGTTTRGERNGLSKLTAADVLQIRQLRRDGFSRKAIALRFGVGPTTISAITQRRNWAWLQDESAA